jgi:hypothetical protein
MNKEMNIINFARVYVEYLSKLGLICPRCEYPLEIWSYSKEKNCYFIACTTGHFYRIYIQLKFEEDALTQIPFTEIDGGELRYSIEEH